MDKRIGKHDDRGKPVYPEHTLSGRPVPKPVTQTISLGPGYFAVPDLFPKADASAVLDELKAKVAQTAIPNTVTLETEARSALASSFGGKKAKSDVTEKPE